MPIWIGKWTGGRTYLNRVGRTVYQLEKSVGGVRYSLKLEVDSERAALAELALFERDPAKYRTKSRAAEAAARQPGPVRLDAEVVSQFVAYLESKERSPVYLDTTIRYLAQWADALAGRDLREVTLFELRQLLAKWPAAKRARIIAIKSFFSWLREEDRVKVGEDPTLALKVPPAVAEKGSRKKGYEMGQVERLYSAVNSQWIRDVLCLQAKTGMHFSEVQRLAAGKGELRAIHHPSGIAGTARFLHKNGRSHLISLDAQTFAAAGRLQTEGVAPTQQGVRKAIIRASARIGQEPLNPGEFRHSFATWAKNHGQVVKASLGGVGLELVASVLGHQSPRTTAKFYDGTEIPPMVAVPLKLHHPEDPALPVPATSAA